MKDYGRKIEDIITPVVEAMGYVVWTIELHRSKQSTVVRIYIDVPVSSKEHTGVSLDSCAKISRQIAALLDVECPKMGSYVLEVSSPGLDRTLTKPEHYQRYVGSQVQVRLLKPIPGMSRKLVGRLDGSGKDSLELLIDEKSVVIPLNDIVKVKLLPSF